jgi:hypothetical protein
MDEEEILEDGTSFASGLVLGLGVGLLIGTAVGLFAGRARYKLKYEKMAEEEIAEMRTFFQGREKAIEAQFKAPLEEVMDYMGYKKAEDQPDQSIEEHLAVQESIAQNVFDTATDHTWDYAAETKLRAANPGRPFVIHLDEYGDEGSFTTSVYTYYEEDEILSDERDEVVDNVDELVGLENLNRFGHGTDNKNILLVRNEALEVDIEITKSNGSYAADVHGFLQHSYPVEKMPKRHERFDDD